ncbi:class I histocompatibility antigen, F10 alpha chain-like [Hemiscyllium ocellatum]|uniref:class I histocompatibility antigen, F10 alpha chain-like n=1 Tax=Hemiscyllium ocellatum TaxID=170820 RepID=UPI002966B94C|nr:class I histocompatibility antigen, F10 alpha chain-like [Hemiscyllium ocellatum]
MLLILFSISLCFSRVSPETDRFVVLFTATSGISDLPKVIGVALLNGVLIGYFDTNLGRTIPKMQFMADIFGEDYWEDITNLEKARADVATEHLNLIMKSTNQTSGIHTLQWIRSVEVSEDGSVKRSMIFGFDGKDYISLEPDRMRWIAANHFAVMTKEKWDSDQSWNEFWKTHLEETCVLYLNRYLEVGKDYFTRKVQPEVFISRREPNGQDKPLTLSCLVTGFYPADIEVTWLRNGEVMSGTYSSGVRPNHDGTHQIQKEIEINAGDEDQYSCQIEHSSLAEAQLYQWEIRERNGGIFIGTIFGFVFTAVVVIGLFGIIMWKRSRRESPRDSE